MDNSDKDIRTTDGNKTDKAFELAKQLHQQYAEADNNKSSNLISAVGALFAVFTGYGYAFVHYSEESDLLILLGAAILAGAILFTLMKITAFHGYALRRDQIIIHRIRQVYEMPNEIYNPDGNTKGAYNPIRKIMNGDEKDILPSYYRILYYTFSGMIYMILAATAIRILLCGKCAFFCCDSGCHCCHCCCRMFGLGIIILMVAGIVCLTCKTRCLLSHYHQKLKDMLTDKEKQQQAL